jgi:hypothetical protein
MQDSEAPQHLFLIIACCPCWVGGLSPFLISGGEAPHICEGKHVEKITRLGRKMKEKEAQTSSTPLKSY